MLLIKQIVRRYFSQTWTLRLLLTKKQAMFSLSAVLTALLVYLTNKHKEDYKSEGICEKRKAETSSTGVLKKHLIKLRLSSCFKTFHIGEY